MVQINTFIFDFDGVLSFDNTHEVFSRFNNLIKDVSIESRYFASKKLYDCMKGKITYDDFSVELAKIAKIDKESAKKLLKQIMETRTIDNNLINLINNLKKEGFLLVLHTDLVKVHFDYWIRRFNLDIYFDHMICSAYIGSLKSEPITYEKLLTKIDKTPKECFFIDDRPSNIYTASTIGIKGHVYINLDSLLKEIENLGILVDNLFDKK